METEVGRTLIKRGSRGTPISRRPRILNLDILARRRVHGNRRKPADVEKVRVRVLA